MSAFLVRDMRREDLPATAGFPPPEWNFDAAGFFAAHFGQPYFHPAAAEVDGGLAGIANALVFGASAWLGNIIVAPPHRRRGLGAALTARLVEICRARGCTSQLLVATELGRPVYAAQGFARTGEYVFLKPGRPVDAPGRSRVRAALPGDLDAIAALDRQATAEDRRPVLSRFLDGGMVHWRGDPDRVDGFYLPAFGQGPVVAESDEAGLTLLRLKHSGKEGTACIPAGNAAGMAMLLSLGFTEDHRAPRMALGDDVPWEQGMVYARGAGYCG